jgi:hypothetical protein
MRILSTRTALLFSLSLFAPGCGGDEHAVTPGAAASPGRALGVCPPFALRDEAGHVINPAKGVNDAVPYSPRQTCGAKGCHDYEKITRGFHWRAPSRPVGPRPSVQNTRKTYASV